MYILKIFIIQNWRTY